MRSHRQGGFTLMETMIALAILAGGLALAIATTAANVRQAHRAQALGVATELARGKMFDLEEELIREGFQDTEQTFDGDFSDEGWPDITWEATVEKIELPGLDALQEAGTSEEAGAQGSSSTDGVGAGLGAGGGAGTAVSGGALGAGIVGSQFEMISAVLEMSIRRVNLTVGWKVGQAREQMTVAAYFTNEQGVAQALAGAPAGGAGAASGGKGGARATTSGGRGQSGRLR